MAKRQGVIGSLGLGAAMGAAGMYFCDPARGSRRRAYVADKLFHYSHATAHELSKAQRDVQHRVHGLTAQLEALGRDGAAPD